MKKYRIVVRTTNPDPKKQIDFLDFNSYKKFNQRYEDLVADVVNLRYNIVKVEKYIGSELTDSCSANR